jgi:hypothetical protein
MNRGAYVNSFFTLTSQGSSARDAKATLFEFGVEEDLVQLERAHQTQTMMCNTLSVTNDQAKNNEISVTMWGRQNNS